MQGNKNGFAGKLMRDHSHHDYFEPLFDQKKESIHLEYQDLKA